MKKLIISLVTLTIFTLTSFGQAPEGFKYQAVIRDAGNLILNNQAVGMRLTIQQGSIGGTAVYTETFAITTNAYGLVNLEIGTGSTVDDFSLIDWSNGPYFIQTAVDITGGVTYAVMGTNQLMSVPYALHATTADNVINDAIDDADADPLNEIQTISRTGTTVTLSNGGGNYEDSVNVYTNGNGIDITGSTISETSYQIGDFAQGGIVFWVDETGEHGLVCAKTDQSANAEWYAGTYTVTMAQGDGIFAGESNTFLAIANQGEGTGGDYATRVCNELDVTEAGIKYGDWYLPSRAELNEMYLNKAVIDATALANSGSSFDSSGGTGYYWSSTENELGFSRSQYFFSGGSLFTNKSTTMNVRAIRAF